MAAFTVKTSYVEQAVDAYVTGWLRDVDELEQALEIAFTLSFEAGAKALPIDSRGRERICRIFRSSDGRLLLNPL